MQASPAPRFSRSAPDDVGGIEAAGAAGEAILQEYGFSKEEIEMLRQTKALK
jgi:crotonobetainyl-CoA:carnitine CoA-transferase CaiB-like acyl-CoA transferase